MAANSVVVLHQEYDQPFDAREQRIIEVLASYGELVVSFSGRLASCYQIDLCRASGVTIKAFILDTPTRSRSEVSRARRYCQCHGIDYWVVRTDEMIFCDNLPDMEGIIDPVQRICEHVATRPDWSGLPILMPVAVEERTEYLERFGVLPDNTIWLMAEFGLTLRDFRYGFNKRQLGQWGRGGNGCLSHRFSNHRLLDHRSLRMVDQAEQMLIDMGLDGAQVFFHILCDSSTTLARVRLQAHQRAHAFDIQSDILAALKSIGFDLVTLDMTLEERQEQLI